MEKSLEKMKLSELYEFKTIVKDLMEEYNNRVIRYQTNGIGDYLTNINSFDSEDKIILNKRIKANALLSRINNLIEEKVKKYYE